MAEFSPHTDLFKIINRLSSIATFIFWSILVFSLIPFISEQFKIAEGVIDTINGLNIIGIGSFFVIEIIIEYIISPQADNRRRDDFIDNSFGSKFSSKSSIGYYDNDEIEKGLYKVSVNLFENCFFTFSLSKIVTISRIVIPAIILIAMSFFAYYGFKEVPFALSILQALFSANILGLLIKHLILINRLTVIQDSWINLFQYQNFKSETYKYQANIYRYWLQYETLIGKINPGIPNRIFKKNNDLLTKEWEQLKAKYNIN